MFCIVCGKFIENGKTCSQMCRTRLSRINSVKKLGFGFIYIVEFQDIIKVGFSVDPNIRVKQIELASGRVGGRVMVYGPYQLGLDIESDIHDGMHEYKICGEWYKRDAINLFKMLIDDYEVCSEKEFDLMYERTIVDNKIKSIKRTALSIIGLGQNHIAAMSYRDDPFELKSHLTNYQLIKSYIDEICANKFTSSVFNGIEYVASELFDCAGDERLGIGALYRKNREKCAVFIYLCVVAKITLSFDGLSFDDVVDVIKARTNGEYEEMEKYIVTVASRSKWNELAI